MCFRLFGSLGRDRSFLFVFCLSGSPRLPPVVICLYVSFVLAVWIGEERVLKTAHKFSPWSFFLTFVLLYLFRIFCLLCESEKRVLNAVQKSSLGPFVSLSVCREGAVISGDEVSCRDWKQLTEENDGLSTVTKHSRGGSLTLDVLFSEPAEGNGPSAAARHGP